MNCPRHIKEITDPEAIRKEKELEKLEDLQPLFAGPEEDFES